MTTWRDAARSVIRRVEKENPNVDEVTMRLKLREAYPFGQRKYHPYKIWLREINEYLKQRKRLQQFYSEML